MTWITGFFTLVGVLKDLISVGTQLFLFIRREYEVSQRKAVATELKAAIQEAVKTYDNTRLNNLLNPGADPFPRKVVDEQPKT